MIGFKSRLAQGIATPTAHGSTGCVTPTWVAIPGLIVAVHRMGSHRERDSPSRRAAIRAPVDSQGGYTHLHFTVRPNNRVLCNSQLWNAFRSPKDAEPAHSEILACLGLHI